MRKERNNARTEARTVRSGQIILIERKSSLNKGLLQSELPTESKWRSLGLFLCIISFLNYITILDRVLCRKIHFLVVGAWVPGIFMYLMNIANCRIVSSSCTTTLKDYSSQERER